MSDRATPETNAALLRYTGGELVTFPSGLRATVDADFASNLERQRDEARKERDKAINRQLSCEAAIVEYEKLFGHVPHEQLLLNMKNTLAKLAKCRQALARICGDATGAYQQIGSHRELFTEISDLARETLDATE